MTLTDAPMALHRAGRIRSPWLPGMRGTHRLGQRVRFHNAWGFDSSPCAAGCPQDGDVEPDLTDPATVGCLLALLIEARGPDAGGAGSVFSVVAVGWDFLHLRTPRSIEEAGRLVSAALIALAEGVTRG